MMIEEAVEGLSLLKSHDDRRIISAQIGWWLKEVADETLVHKSQDGKRIISAQIW